MNEDWATYFHQRIMRELDLSDDVTIEYAKLNSSVVQPSSHTRHLRKENGSIEYRDAAEKKYLRSESTTMISRSFATI